MSELRILFEEIELTHELIHCVDAVDEHLKPFGKNFIVAAADPRHGILSDANDIDDVRNSDVFLRQTQAFETEDQILIVGNVGEFDVIIDDEIAAEGFDTRRPIETFFAMKFDAFCEIVGDNGRFFDHGFTGLIGGEFHFLGVELTGTVVIEQKIFFEMKDVGARLFGLIEEDRKGFGQEHVVGVEKDEIFTARGFDRLIAGNCSAAGVGLTFNQAEFAVEHGHELFDLGDRLIG